jgi:hypothetical protein
VTQLDDPVVASWDEPRGPHVPDLLVRVPRPVWPFVVLAVVLAYVQISDPAADHLADPSTAARLALSVASTTWMALLGAALFWRHPDAWRTHRVLTISVILFALDQPIRLGSSLLRTTVLPPQDPFTEPFVDWASVAFGSLRSIVQVVAIFLLWRAFRDARAPARHSDPISVTRVLIAMAVASWAVGFVFAALHEVDGAQVVATVVFAAQSLVALVSSLAWVAVADVAIVRAGAGDPPRWAWWSAAIASLGFSFGVPIASVTAWTLVTAIGQTAWFVFVVVPAIGAASGLLLLAAVAGGLPGASLTASMGDPPAALPTDSGGS